MFWPFAPSSLAVVPARDGFLPISRATALAGHPLGGPAAGYRLCTAHLPSRSLAASFARVSRVRLSAPGYVQALVARAVSEALPARAPQTRRSSVRTRERPACPTVRPEPVADPRNHGLCDILPKRNGPCLAGGFRPKRAKCSLLASLRPTRPYSQDSHPGLQNPPPPPAIVVSAVAGLDLTHYSPRRRETILDNRRRRPSSAGVFRPLPLRLLPDSAADAARSVYAGALRR